MQVAGVGGQAGDLTVSAGPGSASTGRALTGRAAWSHSSACTVRAAKRIVLHNMPCGVDNPPVRRTRVIPVHDRIRLSADKAEICVVLSSETGLLGAQICEFRRCHRSASPNRRCSTIGQMAYTEMIRTGLYELADHETPSAACA
jgi:hypothetical protein